MKYQPLKNTNLSIPLISLGTMTFGGQTNEAESLSIMDYAFEQGVTLFDTANIYTGGNSESIVSKGLKGRREKIILASKVGYATGSGLTKMDLSKESIMTSIDESLKRLDTDYLDLYYLHAPDYDTPIEESLEAMTRLVESGKVKYLAISNHAAWQVADVLALCEKNAYAKPVMTQNVYNAITRTLEAELLPFLKAHEMGLSVYNPFAAGLLTGKHNLLSPKEGTRLSDNPIYKNRYWTQANLDTTKKLMTLAQNHNIKLVDMAMQWCLNNPKVTSLITGVSKLSQLEENLKVIDSPSLSPEVLKSIDLVWDQHTGSPFAYNR